MFSTLTTLILAGMLQGSIARPIDQKDLAGMKWDANLQRYVKPAPTQWWTYHFGRGKFTSGIWSDILRPTGKFGCILVVQQKAQVRKSNPFDVDLKISLACRRIPAGRLGRR
jgi:hypothetical protein